MISPFVSSPPLHGQEISIGLSPSRQFLQHRRNIHRSDRSFGTLFSDEKDGMLDSDKKAEFFAVKREALKLGTHTREFFITQTPELVDMADGRIVLSPGKVEVS